MRLARLRPAPTTTAAIVVGMGAVLLPLRDVFTGWDWAARIGGGVVVAAVMATALETRFRLGISAMVAVTGFTGATWGALVVGRSVREDPLSLEPLRDLRDGLFDGWNALLDEQFPLRDEQSAQIFVAILVWVATVGAIVAVVRLRSALPAMALCAGMLWVSIAAALPRGAAPLLAGAIAGAATLSAVATLTRGSTDRWRLGRVVSLGVLVTVAGLVALAAGEISARAGRSPVDPRGGRATSIVDLEVPDLLSEYSTRARGDQVVLRFESTGTGDVPSELRLRLQAYDTYDGERWHPSAEFREVARFPEPALLPPGQVIGLGITPRALDGPWIPLPDRLIGIDVTDIAWNEEAQTALVDGGVGPYRVTGTHVDRSGLEGLGTARGDVPARQVEIPSGLPASIARAARDAASGADDPLAAVDAVSGAVRALGRDDGAPPGHSLARLDRDLIDGLPTGPEQLASLHALMLRSLGHPARVVVGFVATDADVRADDLHVWTEVAFDGVGWVAFDPVPAADDPGGDGGDSPTSTTTVPVETVAGAEARPRELGPGDDADQNPAGPTGGSTWRDALVVLAVLMAFVVVVIAASHHLRRRIRRSRGETDERVLGAWAELVDRLREAGAPVSATTTVGDLVYMAEHLDTELGDTTRRLGVIASEALHAPARPSARRTDEAWTLLREAEHRLVEVRGRRTLLARTVDPRALRHRAPSPPPSRHGGRLRSP